MKMTFRRLLSSIIVSLCWLFVFVVEEAVTNNVTAAPEVTVQHSTQGNSTSTRPLKNDNFHVDSSMIQRALFVLIGFTMIGVLYFLIRTVRLKKASQRKKYGLLSNYDDSVEMEAVESEEDDTLYEARSLRR